MAPWVKVITDPLGLAGFALFLLFGLIARLTRNRERQWISRVAVATAVLTLVGCFAVEFLGTAKSTDVPKDKAAAGSTPQKQSNEVHQSTSGPGSPAVQGVQGDVAITVDQSSGQSSSAKKDAKQPPSQGK